MNRTQPTYSVEQIRAAEAPLISAQTEPDQLMRSAAHAVSRVAEMMLSWPLDDDHVLALAGPGGNGGDALYAAAELAAAGHDVTVLLTAGTAHERALAAFRGAGGKVTQQPDGEFGLILDGMTGIGGSAGLREELADAVALSQKGLVLAVDVPSGVDADTGEAGELHVGADVTVTFGGWRRAHVLAPQCGIQLLADIGLPGRPLSGSLSGPVALSANRAVVPRIDLPEGITALTPTQGLDVEPRPGDDKYSGGVVGIRAGSGQYPGAAILCTAGAVNATPSMVRYAGPQAVEVVRAHPEVVATKTLREAGRVQAWVFGPGAGTGETAAKELKWVLEQKVPVLIDADGLTLLAQQRPLRRLVTQREHPTVLTPHDGEFDRLREAAGVAATHRLEETEKVAAALGCTIVRKGRCTLVCGDGASAGIDAGHSWAATPGSGDVLAGMLGAALAMGAELAGAVTAHQVAAKLAAETPYGDATAPASRIAAHIRPAMALMRSRDKMTSL